jgi:hypothetical protein
MKTNEQDLRELVEDLWSYPFLYVTGLFSRSLRLSWSRITTTPEDISSCARFGLVALRQNQPIDKVYRLRRKLSRHGHNRTKKCQSL